MTKPTEQGGEGTWANLRRRKVVQWGAAYAAVAWTLLQGIEYLTETYAWPLRVRQVATLVLVSGLPILLVIAWYHGDRGEQRVSSTEVTIIALLMLLAGGLLWRYEPSDERPAATSGVARPAPPATTPVATPAFADSRPSIAVLPFRNRSDQGKDAFFVDGIHDDILTQLCKVSALKVISRSSVERFRDTRLPLRDVAKQLGVKSILEGGVQRAGDRVHINVQLIDAATDTHLWAETYDRELTTANIFAIQSEVATQIAGALQATLTPTERATINSIPTHSLQAWEAYQVGKQQLAARTDASLKGAERSFRTAMELDSRFALAYAGLAATLAVGVGYQVFPTGDLAAAEKAAETALELDPNLAEGVAAAGMIAQQRQQPERAETLFRRAIELNGNFATAYQWLGGLLSTRGGRMAEAMAYMAKAGELDPLSPIINLNLGLYLEFQGRFEEAEARYRKVIEIDPSMSMPYFMIGRLKAWGLNRFAEGVPYVQKAIELDPERPGQRSWLAMLYVELGDDSKLAEVVAAARARSAGGEDAVLTSAVQAMLRGDVTATRQNAEKMLALNQTDKFALQLLRTLDLQAGHDESARRRYAMAYPELFVAAGSGGHAKIHNLNFDVAVDVALLLQRAGDNAGASALLNGAEEVIRSMPRLGTGYGITDVLIHALRGDKAKALRALRAAADDGWRGSWGSGWFWHYYRDFDPNLASIRGDPEFRNVFADIEQDMARQRAELAARPKDAPLDFVPVH